MTSQSPVARAFLPTFVSLANLGTVVFSLSSRSLKYIMKNVSPSSDSWGTPFLTGRHSEAFPVEDYLLFSLGKPFSYHAPRLSLVTPNKVDWGVARVAPYLRFSGSRYIRSLEMWSSLFSYIPWKNFNKLVKHECLFKNCAEYRKLYCWL